MSEISRRTFVQCSAGAALGAASSRLLGLTYSPSFFKNPDTPRVTDANFSWEYTRATDTFQLRDSQNRLIVSGPMQPIVTVSAAGEPGHRRHSSGKPSEPRFDGNRIAIAYEGVNGADRLSVAWRFDENGIWTEPVVYESASASDVVSFHYFAEASGDTPTPALHATYLVIPGISASSAISPILREEVSLNEDVCLGRGPNNTLSQQWGLPVHYFCGFSVGAAIGDERNSFTEHESNAFTCGLADLPGGDLHLQLAGGNSSLWVNYRSDLWHHLRGPGPLTLGATLYWSVAPDYYQAIAAYYQGLLQAGVIHKSQPSAQKIATALSPQFCSWGAQWDRNKGGEQLDDAFLDQIYGELKTFGMKARLFSIDDKWEQNYGSLQHSSSRLPHFEQFLDRLRSEGCKIGIWAALMRCEHPENLGLTIENVLKMPNGEPFVLGSEPKAQCYILDFTQPEVARVLEEVVRNFIRRYKPDLLKFDFGYEMPRVDVACPKDKQWSGERLMSKGLDIVINAMRQENPDLVVMYYQLSPLFLNYFDLHGVDDLWMCAGEYDFEANRRLFFSSLLGRLGVPTYSSSGYDWASSPNIWFDGVALGAIGSLNDFHGDERGESQSPELIAKYNGLTHALRPTVTFEILPINYLLEAPSQGAHPRSWARFEEGNLVLLAMRPSLAWEASPLSLNTDDPRIKNAVRCVAPVVVASKTNEGIASTSKLAIVPYGEGEIVVRRETGKKAEIVAHYFGDVSEIRSSTAIGNGELKLAAQERNAAGVPLEWIEVNIV